MCINGPRVAPLVTSSEKLSNVIYVFYYQLSDTGKGDYRLQQQY